MGVILLMGTAAVGEIRSCIISFNGVNSQRGSGEGQEARIQNLVVSFLARFKIPIKVV